MLKSLGQKYQIAGEYCKSNLERLLKDIAFVQPLKHTVRLLTGSPPGVLYCILL